MASPANYMIGKGIVSVRAYSAAPSLWTATTPVLVGQSLMTVAGAIYNVTTGGTTSATAPTGTTSSVTDGTATLAYINWVDIGNCPKFEFKPDLKTLDHYTSRSFSMTQDAKVITQVGGKVTVVCDEITTYNLAIGVLGTTTGTVGTQVTQVLARAGFQCQIKLTQTNSVGLRHEWIFTNVLCIPDKAISIIDTKFAEIELTGDTLIDPNGSFGTVTEIA